MLFSATNSFAQNKTIDSLKIALKNAKHDTTRMGLLISIGEAVFMIKPDTAFSNWMRAKDLAEKNLQQIQEGSSLSVTLKRHLAASLNALGFAYKYKGETSKALDFYNKSMANFEAIGDKEGVAVNLLNMGVIYQNKGETAKTIECYEKSLKIMGELGDKFGTANALANFGNFYFLSDLPKALELYFKALKIYEELGNKQRIAISNGNIGNVYWKQGNLNKSIEYFNKCLKIQEEIFDNVSQANSLHNIGNLYKDQGNVSMAIDYFSKSLKISEDNGLKSNVALSLQSLANIYLSQGDFQKAIEYNNKSLKIFEEIDDKKGITHSLDNIGLCYKKQNDFIKSLEYYNKALKIKEIIKDKSGLGQSYNLIGGINKEQGDYTSALENFTKGLKVSEEFGDKKQIAYALNNIGVIYLRQKNYPMALEYALKSMEKSKEVGSPDNMRFAAELLFDVYSATGNYQLALENYKLFIQMRDSINNITTQKASIKQQSKYEYDKQTALAKISFEKTQDSLNLIQKRKMDLQALEFEYQQKQANAKSEEERRQLKFEEELKRQQIESNFREEQATKEAEHKRKEAAAIAEQEKKEVIAKEEKEKQKVILFSVLAGLFLVIVFAVFMFNRFRVTQKQKNIIELKEKETQQQNEVIKIQKHLVEEKHKEITDSINYAERIQRSFLATEKQLNENLNNYFVLFKPKDVVSGDFYWSAKLNNGNFALVTADSTGHGVPGAIMSLLNVTSLEKAIEHQTNPADILNHTRQTIIERLKKDGSEEGGKDGMDCSLLVFDFNNKQLLISAANNPVWVIRNNEMIEIKPDKMPVGKNDKQDQSFTTHTIELQKGDSIYTLTDGFPDQFGGEKGKKFMSKKLKELLLANVHLSIAQQKELLDSTFKNWVGDLEQVDDVTVIGIKV